MNILLLTTGGTIASQEKGGGLVPAISPQSLLSHVVDLTKRHTIHHEEILNMDSSNIQPEEWQLIAAKIYHSLPLYDGIIVTHGTDTMAYTAAAVSFMIQNLNKSVVFTGSQVPIDNPMTDAKTNLYTAVAAIESGIKGVSVAFNRKIINGTRAVKISTLGFNAFESVNSACMGEVFADGMRVYTQSTSLLRENLPVKFDPALCKDVFLLKLLPGTKPEVFDMILQLGYKGIVMEVFGAGGLHYAHRNLLDKLEHLHQEGVAVAVCSQCTYERCDLSIYDIGQRLLERKVIPCHDMTTEAAAVKLMWSLTKTRDLDKLQEMFDTNFVGEVYLE
jgi:L-asparaginase